MNSEDRAAWGPLVSERREQLGMTQRQLADVADVAAKTIHNLETAGMTPRPATLRKIQRALGLSSDIEVARERVASGREGAVTTDAGSLEQVVSAWKRAEADVDAAKSVEALIRSRSGAEAQLAAIEAALGSAIGRLVDVEAEIVGLRAQVAALYAERGRLLTLVGKEDQRRAIWIDEDDEVVTRADVTEHTEPPRPDPQD